MSSGKFHSKSRPNLRTKNAGDHDISECNHKLHNQYIHHKPARAVEGKEIVSVYNADGTREMIVPKRKPTDLPGIFPKSEFTRLQNQAHVITKEERQAMIKEAKMKKQMLEDESNKRIEALHNAKLDQKAAAGSKLGNVELESKQKNLYLLQRAFELRQEQEDEIKKANGVILATKCLAIRNAQLLEKELMDKQLAEENHRLDMMMEQRRQREIQAEKEKQIIQEKKRQKFVGEMMEQIRENEVARLVEAEKIEEESRMINKALIQMRRDEEEQQRIKLENQRKNQEESKKANEELEKFKIIKKEEERIANFRVQEFMRKKAEREAARQAELLAIKKAKEEEIARLQAQQLKAQEQAANLDELNALRIQEEVEKEWREKEKQAALKRKQQLEELKRGRANQIEDIRKLQAIELARDESEFHKVAKVQKELHEKDMEKKRKQREANVQHRKELLKQINEKEKERIVQLQEKFEEGNTLRLEQEVRTIYINQYLKQKIEKLRQNKLPEKYVRDIERQLNVKK